MDSPAHSRSSSQGSLDNGYDDFLSYAFEIEKYHPAAGEGNSKTTTDDLPAEEHFVKLIVSESMPILFQESSPSMRFFTLLNPAFAKLTTAGLKKSAAKYYYKETESLKSILRGFNGRVSLTSSIWSDSLYFSEEDCVTYLYLNCHWIDEQWVKQSRVIGFQREYYCPADSDLVLEKIMGMLSKWRLKDKILSINFDSKSNHLNAVAVKLQDKLNPVLDGKLFISKCVYEVIDSCFTHGFSEISIIVDKVRSIINIVEHRGTKQVKQMCRQRGLKYKRLLVDMPVWKNTTFDMVDAFLGYRPVLTEFCTLPDEYDSMTPLTEDEWSVLSSLRDLFQRFKTAFVTFCSVYTPTTNSVVPVLLTLSEAFSQYRDDRHIGSICSSMEAKFSAYWIDHGGISMVYCLATILDPRYKLDGLFKLLDAYHVNMKLPIGDTKTGIKTLFYQAYDAYFQKFGLQTGSSSSNGGGNVSYTELENYLSCGDAVSSKLDVLKWWKRNQARYPVLAAMAREVLAPLASTKLPEDTYRFHGGGLNERRYEFGPRISEMSVCYKDWILAEQRKQHLYVNECDD
ncbi:Zinc finger BED domain-containing protein RICESLEEPER 1 [Linum grandiflorum]